MKLTKSSLLMIGLFLLAAVVAGCSRQPVAESALPTPEATAGSLPVENQPGAQEPQEAASTENSELAKTDEQGQVVVVVTPLNLENPGQTLDFEVDMNTHSVELGLDLAALATLTTDTGQSLAASAWEAPGGGHHVAGTLSFPIGAEDGSILEGAKAITLTIVDLDVPERIFEWTLP